MSTFPSDEAIERSLALVTEVENQTDRGVAIVGVAWVEESLLAAIHSFLEKGQVCVGASLSKKWATLIPFCQD